MLFNIQTFAERELQGAMYGNIRHYAFVEKVDECALRICPREIEPTVRVLVYLKDCITFGSDENQIRKLVDRQTFRYLEQLEQKVEEDENMYLTRIAKEPKLRITLLAYLQTDAAEALKRNDFQLAFEKYGSIAKLMQNILEEN